MKGEAGLEKPRYNGVQEAARNCSGYWEFGAAFSQQPSKSPGPQSSNHEEIRDWVGILPQLSFQKRMQCSPCLGCMLVRPKRWTQLSLGHTTDPCTFWDNKHTLFWILKYVVICYCCVTNAHAKLENLAILSCKEGHLNPYLKDQILNSLPSQIKYLRFQNSHLQSYGHTRRWPFKLTLDITYQVSVYQFIDTWSSNKTNSSENTSVMKFYNKNPLLWKELENIFC